jgi:hypothetical protein
VVRVPSLLIFIKAQPEQLRSSIVVDDNSEAIPYPANLVLSDPSIYLFPLSAFSHWSAPSVCDQQYDQAAAPFAKPKLQKWQVKNLGIVHELSGRMGSHYSIQDSSKGLGSQGLA